jgi:hypothetical protein
MGNSKQKMGEQARALIATLDDDISLRLAPIRSDLAEHNERAAIHAVLTGSDTASAEGITVTSPSPILSLCRQLITRGYDPNLPLIAARGQTVCLKIRSIGEAARLRVGGHGVGFEGGSECGAAPPITPSAPARTGTPGKAGDHRITYIAAQSHIAAKITTAPASARRARRKATP